MQILREKIGISMQRGKVMHVSSEFYAISMQGVSLCYLLDINDANMNSD